MDITCPKCKTEYEFEEMKIGEAGVTVKCTTCNFMFRVRRKAVVETEPVYQADHITTVKGSTDDPQNRVWMIQTTNGQVLKFKELTTLQQWIVERKVSQEDFISRSGEAWKRLGDIPELGSFFQVVQAAKLAEAGFEEGLKNRRGGTSPLPQMGGPGPDQGNRPRKTSPISSPSGTPFRGVGSPPAMHEPAFAAGGGSKLAPVGKHAAWEKSSSQPKINVAEDDGLDDEFNRPILKRFKWPLIIGASLLGLTLLGIGLQSLLGGQDKERKLAAYIEGHSLILQDDEDSLRQAEAILAKAPETNILVQATRASLLTIWTQHLRDEVFFTEYSLKEYDKELQAAEQSARIARQALEQKKNPANKTAAPPTAPANSPESSTLAEEQALRTANEKVKKLNAQIAQLRQKILAVRAAASQKLGQAEAFAVTALKAKSNLGEAKLAMADYLRLRGNAKDEYQKIISEARQLLPEDAEAAYVEAMFSLENDDYDQAKALFEKAQVSARKQWQQPLFRGLVGMAQLHLRQRNEKAARADLTELLKLNPRHKWADSWLEGLTKKELSPSAVAAALSPTPPPTSAPAVPAAAQAKAPPPTSAGKPAAAPMVTSLGNEQTATASTGNYENLVKQANSLMEKGRTTQAQKLYEQALKANQSGTAALTGLGYCYLDKERFAEAINYFKRALTISSGDGEALIGMAESYKIQGNSQKALEYYRAYVQVLPGGPKATMAKRNAADLERRLGASTPPAPAAPAATDSPSNPPTPAPAPAQPVESSPPDKVPGQ